MVIIQNPDGTFQRVESQHKVNTDGWEFWQWKRWGQTVVRPALEKIKRYCDLCHVEFDYANPCIHHLSDSFLNRKRYWEFIKKVKKGTAPEGDPNQSKFQISKGINTPDDVEEEDGEEIN